MKVSRLVVSRFVVCVLNFSLTTAGRPKPEYKWTLSPGDETAISDYLFCTINREHREVNLKVIYNYLLYK